MNNLNGRLPVRIYLSKKILDYCFAWSLAEFIEANRRGGNKKEKDLKKRFWSKYMGLCAEAALMIYFRFPIRMWQRPLDKEGLPDVNGFQVRCSLGTLLLVKLGIKGDNDGTPYIHVRQIDTIDGRKVDGVYEIDGVLWEGAAKARELKDAGNTRPGDWDQDPGEDDHLIYPSDMIKLLDPRYRCESCKDVEFAGVSGRFFIKPECYLPYRRGLDPSETPWTKQGRTGGTEPLGERCQAKEDPFNPLLQFYPREDPERLAANR
jgi:hypothetical protein